MIAIAPYVVVNIHSKGYQKKMRREVFPEMILNSMNDRVY